MFEIHNSEYFKVATGWELTYMKSGSSLRSGFRPQIKLILPAEVQEEATKSAESLVRAISDYYASKKVENIVAINFLFRN